MPQPSLKAQAIRLLARREYPAAELERRLLAKGADADAVKGVLAELSARGLLSDLRYAQAVINQKAGQYGRQAISRALKQKGVDASAASEALAALPLEDEFERARALWLRRFGTPPRD